MESQPVPMDQEARKPCIACGEMIPAHATVCSHCLHSQVPEKSSPMKAILGWVGGISAILGLGATLMGGLHSLTASRAQRAAVRTELVLAQTQVQQSEYEAALGTYKDILQKDPHNPQAREGQRDALMLWTENFHALVPEGQDAGTIAGPKLDQIFGLLDAERIHSQGPQLADVLAHIGWAHWLNQHIASREFGDAAKQNLKAALALDPANVYANAMLGNLLLQTRGTFSEVNALFATAISTGKERPFVRRMQLGGLIEESAPGARAALAQAVNGMRKTAEPLDDERKHRVAEWLYNPIISSPAERAEGLGAAPPDQTWATYQWLAQPETDDGWKTIQNEFIQASILEVSGQRAQALDKFRALQQHLEAFPASALHHPVDEAIKRLSHPA
jgi:tetratricopeptide (TPR) repeat protein